jgi:hypothetical protein
MKRASSLAIALSVAVSALAGPNGTKDIWPSFGLKSAEMHLQMPSKPVPSITDMNSQKCYVYTCDSLEGRFVAAYTPIPEGEQGMILREITSDPGSKGIRAVMSATVASFAKGGKAKIVEENAGVDKGLPADFATLKHGDITLRMRVYFCSKRLYVFAAASDQEDSARFFESIKIPAELSSQ